MNELPVIETLRANEFVVEAPRASIKVTQEASGRGKSRFIFVNPLEWEPGGKRHRRVRSESPEEIRFLALKVATALLVRRLFPQYNDPASTFENGVRYKMLDELLQQTGSSPLEVIGIAAPLLARLRRENAKVTLDQVLADGLDHHFPRNPMKLREVVEKNRQLQGSAGGDYLRHFDKFERVLLMRHGETEAHLVTDKQLKALLEDLNAGEFLTEEQRERRREKREADGLDVYEDGYYGPSTLRHYYNAWHQIFRQAMGLKALPLKNKLPTELITRPAFDPGEPVAIKPPALFRLLPILDPEERRYVISNVYIDLRPAEQGRIWRYHITLGPTGLPIEIFVPAGHVKGKKGFRQARSVQLRPTGALWLASCMPPEGGKYLGTPPAELQKRIRAKAEAIGIEWEHNFLRHAHDSYLYLLLGSENFNAANASHSEKRSKLNYRDPSATYSEALSLWRHLPSNTSANLQKWALEWVEDWVRKRTGGLPPAENPPPAPPVPDARPAPVADDP